jgi:hypothetical protein
MQGRRRPHSRRLPLRLWVILMFSLPLLPIATVVLMDLSERFLLIAFLASVVSLLVLWAIRPIRPRLEAKHQEDQPEPPRRMIAWLGWGLWVSAFVLLVVGAGKSVGWASTIGALLLGASVLVWATRWVAALRGYRTRSTK